MLTVWSQAEGLTDRNKHYPSEALCLVGGDKLILWLVGCLGFEPRLAICRKSGRQFRRSGVASTPEAGVRAVLRLCINLGPGICPTTEENHGKISARASEKCLAYQCRARFVWSSSGGLDWSVGTRRSRFTLWATRPE
jgi:hypothetical protein